MSTIEKALAKQQQNKTKSASTDEKEVPATVEPTIATQNTQSTVEATDVANDGKMITLNGDRLNERGFIFGTDGAHHIQEEFRHIKRKLLNNAFGAAAKTLKHSNLVMITSTNPNEGKTFVAINLALSIALEQDKTVLLVDADVLRPSIQRELEYENKFGLLEFLLDEAESLSDVIYNTSISNLKLIPAGKPHHLTNELLASEKMAALAQELAARYPDRIVIFDCPPILGVTETPVLSSLVGQAVVVVEESKTKVANIKKAVTQLDENIAIGFVMNKTIKSKKDEYGYYGYGYGKNN